VVNTKKFSEFAVGSLTTTTKKMAGISNTSGGENIIMDFTVEWNTAGRPSPPYDGLLGYNTDLKQYEYYDGTAAAWVQLADNAVFVNAKFIVQQPNASLPAAQALSALSTGILKSTTTTGVLSISAPLTSIDGLTTAADLMLYTTASNVYATTSLTAFARTLLDDTSATAMRSTLGLGQAAVKNVTDNTKSNVASVTGSFVVGHVLLAADSSGTVVDGGSPAGMGTVLEVDTGTGLTGGPITTTGTISLDVPVVLANGGTSAVLTASNGGIVYSTATAMAILSGTATASLPLLSGSSSAPSWGAFALSLGGVLTTAGALTTIGAFDATFTFTNTTSVTFPVSGTLATTADIPTLPLSPTNGGTGVSDPTIHGIMVAEGASAMTPVVLSSGQILIGSTGADPVAAAVNSGSGILVANGAGSITVSLAAIADHTLLANISGGALAPSSTTLTALIDNAIGSTQGDILYRNATVWTVLAPGTAGQLLTTGGAAANPSWTTSTFPTTGGAAGNILISNGTNYIASTSLWPNTVGTAGTILRSNGTSNAYTTSTFADTYGVSTILYASSANVVSGLATANSSVLITSSGGVPSLSTTLPSGIAATNMALTTPTIKGSNGFNVLTFSDAAASTDYVSINANISNASSIQLVSSNSTGSLRLLSKGNAPTVIGTETSTTAPLYILLGSNAIQWSASLTGSRTLTFPDANRDLTQIPASTATSGQVLRSGASAQPTWSTATYPSTAGTAGNFIKSDGTNFSSAAFVAPTQQRFTSGTGTYTTPAGVLYIRVRMVGGGGGGAGSGTATGTAAGAGGNSTFGTTLLVANGGGAAVFGLTGGAGGGAGGSASLGSGPIGTAITGGSGGGGTFVTTPATVNPGGADGASGPWGGAGGGGQQQVAGSAAIANSGSGGGGGGDGNGLANSVSGTGGGAGGYVDALISSPSATYAYAVGAAGTAGGAGTSGFAGGAGGSGYIEVTEYYQ